MKTITIETGNFVLSLLLVAFVCAFMAYYVGRIIEMTKGPKRRKMKEEIADIFNNPDKYLCNKD